MNALEWMDWLNSKGSTYTTYDCNPVLMEDYANYKTKEIYGLLFDFRNMIVLNGGLSDFTILRKFDEHFKITADRHGTTG